MATTHLRLRLAALATLPAALPATRAHLTHQQRQLAAPAVRSTSGRSGATPAASLPGPPVWRGSKPTQRGLPPLLLLL